MLEQVPCGPGKFAQAHVCHTVPYCQAGCVVQQFVYAFQVTSSREVASYEVRLDIGHLSVCMLQRTQGLQQQPAAAVAAIWQDPVYLPAGNRVRVHPATHPALATLTATSLMAWTTCTLVAPLTRLGW